MKVKLKSTVKCPKKKILTIRDRPYHLYYILLYILRIKLNFTMSTVYCLKNISVYSTNKEFSMKAKVIIYANDAIQK